MYDIKEIIQELMDRKDMESKEIPSIYLYMDQLLSLFDENFPYNYGEQKLTKTMINNYAKGAIIQHAYKKKYNKEHILTILVTCMLKRELSLSEIKILLDKSVEKVENFKEKSEKKLKKTHKLVDKNTELVLGEAESENDLKKELLKLDGQDENEKFEIEEIYDNFLNKKEILENLVKENMDSVLETLKEDQLVGNNRLLDVMLLCYCSNILSETARAIIRKEIQKD